MMATLPMMSVPVTEPNVVKHLKGKILLVDDDPAVRQILRRLLTEEGYLVFGAANGMEALEQTNNAKFDLVLLDLNMPVKDGWETLEKFSAKNPLLPIILITARTNQLFPALASGVGALMEKPLDFVKLFHAIQDLLNEPMDVRLARSMGRSAAFRHIPPKAGRPEKGK